MDKIDKKSKELLKKNKITKKNIKRRTTRQFFVFAFFSVILIYFLLRITYIYAVYGDEYSQRTIRQQVYGRRSHVDRIIRPNRGTILDRNGHILATSNTVYNVFLDVRLLAQARENQIAHTIQGLYDVLNIEPSRILSYIEINPETERPNRDTHFLILEREVDTLIEQRLRSLSLLHVHSEEDTQRFYPTNNISANIIGFLSGDYNHWGLEGRYNDYLIGIEGRRVRMFNEFGSAVTNHFSPITGNTLVTTLDYRLMEMAGRISEEYGNRYNANIAQVLIMDPNTGEILAMSQYPTFNNNYPTNFSYINSEILRNRFPNLSVQEATNELFGVWTNRAISYSFEPGSIFKPIVHSAALEEGLTYLGEEFFCPGYMIVAGQRISCWIIGGHGIINLEQSMAASCNVVSMILGARLGRDTMYNYLRDFGVGRTTGIDLNGEASAFALTYSRNQLNPVEIATTSFGQGFNMTAIQSMVAFSSIINGGDIVVPYIVSQILDGDNIVIQNTKTIRRNVISREVSEIWRNSMVGTIDWYRGTGTGARISGHLIGGKTGTAQQSDRVSGEYVFSFLGYLPADSPRYLVMVSLDRPNFPNEGSGPIQQMLRDVIEELIFIIGIRPHAEENIINSQNETYIIMPNFVGRTFLDAFTYFRENGVSVDPIGNGTIIANQYPEHGNIVMYSDTIRLYLSENGDNEYIIPDFLGMTINEARVILDSLVQEYIIVPVGFNENNINNSIDINSNYIVITQYPGAGSFANEDSTIILMVSN
ncbi:MAG: penicillin-binding transpeptidase domain-containing protein [Defluviitaleaceae bacterium]|nr:penicillin-binding transpeptidase domain-containing protein [Defluviitaleaceae bacterium]